MSRLLIALLLALSDPASVMAEGPGTRIRSSSDLPRLFESLQRGEAGACARLQGASRQRCLDEARKPVATGRSTGPESTGMGSGAGRSMSGGSSSGTSGDRSSGASAPR